MRLFIVNNRVINVFVIMLISYLTVHLLHLGFTFFCAVLIEIPNVEYYFAYVDYNVEEYKAWSRLRVVLLFGFPTFMMLVTAFVFWIIMHRVSFKDNSKGKIYLLWSIVISLSFFLADFISAPFYRHGVSVVADWYYFKKETVFIISLLFWAVIPLIGWYFSETFMRIAYSRRYLRTKWTRMSFLSNVLLLPFSLVAVLFAFLLIIYPGYNAEYYLSIDFVRFFVAFSVIFFVMLFNFHKRYLGIKGNKELEHLNYTFLFVALTSVSVIYLTLYII